jgi:hypothetical protein
VWEPLFSSREMASPEKTIPHAILEIHRNTVLDGVLEKWCFRSRLHSAHHSRVPDGTRGTPYRMLKKKNTV